MLYEADDFHEARMVQHGRLILVSPFQQPRKHVWYVHVRKIVSTVMLWVLWKCRCSRLYDATNRGPSYVLLEIWETLLTVVRGQDDNMYGSPENVHKRTAKLLHLSRKLPLFVVSNQGPQWSYRLPWTLSWISVHHGNVPYQVARPLYKLFLYVQVLVYILCLLFYVVILWENI